MSAEGKPWAIEVNARSVGSATVITVSGEVDVASAPRLQTAIEDALRGNPVLLVLDLSSVGFLGSAGLSVLLMASESARQDGLRVVVSDQVRRPIEVTGLDKLLVLFDTLDGALAAG
ncbi:STAS domain-containing protein [Nocardia sp. KC 131]|uniref:STAS domain-containing protein n=1 Tax=Nocardia arseniciresistens TaxID=3392119 RepID=UPI00398E822C